MELIVSFLLGIYITLCCAWVKMLYETIQDFKTHLYIVECFGYMDEGEKRKFLQFLREVEQFERRDQREAMIRTSLDGIMKNKYNITYSEGIKTRKILE